MEAENMTGPLLSWFDENARILPWREDKRPYRIWISEIMLQQTRVEAVKPYFERFMKTFPSIHDLAVADMDVLLKTWEGLGYYNRARNLQKTAVILEEKYHGELPYEYEELLKLPGIGPYTAGAVSSIAYGRQAPAVDGNVLRVFMRLFADASDISKESVKKNVSEKVLSFMPKDRAGDFNQALMELGATVCVPNGQPKCDVCPLNGICEANRKHIQEQFPVKAKKKRRKKEMKTILILHQNGKIAIRKRPESGLLSGLYEFPGLEGHYTEEGIEGYLKSMGFSVRNLKKIESSKHIFSHIEWHMQGYYADVFMPDEKEPPFLFIEQGKADENYPIPSAFFAYRKYLD